MEGIPETLGVIAGAIDDQRRHQRRDQLRGRIDIPAQHQMVCMTYDYSPSTNIVGFKPACRVDYSPALRKHCITSNTLDWHLVMDRRYRAYPLATEDMMTLLLGSVVPRAVMYCDLVMQQISLNMQFCMLGKRFLANVNELVIRRQKGYRHESLTEDEITAVGRISEAAQTNKRSGNHRTSDRVQTVT